MACQRTEGEGCHRRADAECPAGEVEAACGRDAPGGAGQRQGQRPTDRQPEVPDLLDRATAGWGASPSPTDATVRVTPGGDRVNSGVPPTPVGSDWKLTVPLASVTVPVNDGRDVTDGTGLHDWAADADTSMLHVLSDCSVPCTESWPSPSTVMSAATDSPLVPSENETVDSWNGTPANGVNGPAIGPLVHPAGPGWQLEIVAVITPVVVRSTVPTRPIDWPKTVSPVTVAVPLKAPPDPQ